MCWNVCRMLIIIDSATPIKTTTKTPRHKLRKFENAATRALCGRQNWLYRVSFESVHYDKLRANPKSLFLLLLFFVLVCPGVLA